MHGDVRNLDCWQTFLSLAISKHTVFYSWTSYLQTNEHCHKNQSLPNRKSLLDKRLLWTGSGGLWNSLRHAVIHTLAQEIFLVKNFFGKKCRYGQITEHTAPSNQRHIHVQGSICRSGDWYISVQEISCHGYVQIHAEFRKGNTARKVKTDPQKQLKPGQIFFKC